MNPWLLMSGGFSDVRWAGFGQIADHGGTVLKGQHGSLIVYYHWIIKKDKATDEVIERFPLFKYLRVFNIEQTNLVEAGKIPSLEDFAAGTPRATDEECEAVFSNMPSPPKFRHDAGMEATYCVMTDEVTMPLLESFHNVEAYYGTLWHELTHSTRHTSRLNRTKDSRAFEELVAEMGAALISAEIGKGVELEQSAAYIGSWLRELRDDKKFVVQASNAAQKAVDYILGHTFGDGEKKTEETTEGEESEED